MARIHRVRKAQQRYVMVPVTDPETGQQKTVTTTRQTRAKGSRPARQVVQRLTKPDLTRPLPPHKCDYCGEPIEVGQPYMWIQPKSGPYGGRKRFRHQGHQAWHVWEYSSSLSARLAEIEYEFSNELANADDADAVQEALDTAAQAAEDLAEEKREAAVNIEEGFGHPTEKSEELNQIADSLESWAEEIRSASYPDYPEPEETDCDCGGDDEACKTCGGEGTYTPDEVTEEQIDEWRSDVESELTIVGEPPV